MNNYEKIKQLDIKELALFLQENFDSDEENFGCLSCTSYETHHYPELCKKDNCYWLKISGSILKWLESESEEE